MAQETEKVVIKNEIQVISDSAKKKLEELEKVAKRLKKSLEPGKKDALEGRILHLQEFIKQLNTLNNIFNGRNFKGQFTTAAESVSYLNTQVKSLAKNLKSLQNYESGLLALSNRAKIAGRQTRLEYGTPTGMAYQQMKLDKKRRDMERELARQGVNRTKQAFSDRYNDLMYNSSTGMMYQNMVLENRVKQMERELSRKNILENKRRINDEKDAALYGDPLAGQYQRVKTKRRIRQANEDLIVDRLEKVGYTDEDHKAVKRFATLDKYLGVTQLKLMANYAAINTVIGGFKYLLNYTGQLNAELKQLQAISTVSDTGLQSLKDTIYDVAGATKFTALEITQASTVLAQAGLSVSQIKDTLPAIAKLATATGTSLETATDVITSTLNIYNLQVTEATQVTNALTTAVNESKADIEGFQKAIQYAGNFASQLGISYEETAAAIAAATQAGIRSRSMLGTGFRAVLTEFLKPTKKLEDQLKKVGLTLSDIDVRGKGFTKVLRTLKEAGFGASEAFRGMERRGAAFLVSLINQVDYIGQLRQKMAGSTAASEANEKQMEALSHQWKNFQSILGNVAYEGLEPVIELLSKLLKMINGVMSSKAVNLVGRLLFNAGTAGGVVAAVALLLKSLKSIKDSVQSLSRAFEVFSRLSKMKGLSGSLLAVGGKLTSFRSLGSLALMAGSLTALVSVLTAVGNALGLFTTAGDRAKASLEESLGTLDKAQQKYNALQNITARLYKDQYKLNDQIERDIFTQEILTRFPEATQYVKNTTLSFEELVEVVEKLNGLSLDNLVKETKKLHENSLNTLYAKGEESLDKIINPDLINFGFTSTKFNSFGKDLAKLMNKANFGTDRKSGLLNTVQDYIQKTPYVSGNTLERMFTKDMTRQLSQALVGNVREAFPYSREAQVSALRTLAGDPELAKFKELIDLTANGLESYYNSIKAEVQDESFKLLSDNLGDLSQEATNLVEKGGEVQKIMETIISTGSTKFSSEQVKNILGTQDNLNNFIERLGDIKKAKSPEELTSLMGLNKETSAKFIKIIEDKARKQGITPEKATKDFSDFISNRLQTSFNSLIETLGNLEDTIEKSGLGSKFDNNLAKDQVRNINSKISGLSSIPQEDIQKEVNEIRDLISKWKEYARAGAGLGNLKEGDVLTPEQKNAEISISLMFDNFNKKLNASQEKLISTIDTTSIKMDYFFKELKANIEAANRAYEHSLNMFKKPETIQSGRIRGAERSFGSNSIVAGAEGTVLKYLHQHRETERYLDDVQYLNKLEQQLDILRSNPLYSKYKEEYNSAKTKFELAKASGSSADISSTYKKLNVASDNYYKFEKQETSLVDSIDSLKEKMTELKSVIEYDQQMQNLSGTDSLSLGYHSGLTQFNDSVASEGINTLAGTVGKLTNGGLNALSDGFAELFTNITRGSMSAGEAFKNFAKNVIQAIGDIAAQMMAKQIVMALFNAIDFGGASGGVSESGGSSSSFRTVPGKAQGGLVIGPVKNRDSVPTSLMPGEYVLKKSAVDALGTDYLDNLNKNSSSIMNNSSEEMSDAINKEKPSSKNPSSGVVNVYVVSQDQQNSLTPNDVLVTVSQDMLQGGQTKKLVKQIAMGSL